MCVNCIDKSADSITLTNGVFVPAPLRREAAKKAMALVAYERDILGFDIRSEKGPTWELIGYCHGHIEELPDEWDHVLKSLGIMEEDRTIPTMLQWAFVSLCCHGERLGKYARHKARY